MTWTYFKKRWRKIAQLSIGAICLSLLIALSVWKAVDYSSNDDFAQLLLDSEGQIIQPFTYLYPANKKFQHELDDLRKRKLLTPKNEIAIHEAIARASQLMGIPRSVLWCLFFQESRLNHLAGIRSGETTFGLGQFGYFSFYEVNHQTNRYNNDSLRILITLLGSDVRPVAARKSDIYNHSSYYYIPTAVTSSALYLRNRYSHLKKLLDLQSVGYDPNLLWLYSIMAYNKGTRSILAIWNEVRTHWGESFFTKMIQEQAAFEKLALNPKVIQRSLKRIWPTKKALKYATELAIHAKNIQACSLEPIPIEEL